MLMRKAIFSLIVIALLLSACSGPGAQPAQTPASPAAAAGLPWWSDSTFYQIFVRSFADSTGNGIGDFNGLIEKLDYLNDGNPETTSDLGITGIWLLPIHPSPSYHGYDVLDYYEVNPDYGTMEDFKRLLDEAHQRGIRIIIDLVLNHTSEQHPWFRDSRSPDSEFRDWYVWEENDPGFVGPWGQRVWHRSTSGYYYGVFWGGMPDLNYRNPEVTAQMYDVARFWLEEVGVDGFRIDGAQHLIEEGDVQRHSEPTHEWFQEFRTFVKSVNPDALLVGEVWDTNFAVTQYVQGDQLDLAFNFDLAEAMLAAANTGSARSVRSALGFTQRLLPNQRFGAFLTNHDIDRVMSQLGNDEGKARVAASLVLTMPGVPFIYYGEEIGMVGQKPDERIRTPMQWAAGQGAGFTTGVPWQSLQRDYTEKNVELQQDDPDSLFNHYRLLSQLRNRSATLRIGDLTVIEASQQPVFASLRHFQDDLVLVLVNLGRAEISNFNLSLAQGPLIGEYAASVLFGQANLNGAEFLPPTANPNGGFNAYQPLPILPPYSTVIVQLQAR